MSLYCLLLAAGSSARMGQNKLLLKRDGVSLVRRTLEEIVKVPALQAVVVTGHERERVEAELQGLPCVFVHNPHAAQGMHASLRAGIETLPATAEGFFVCLADQPYFSSENLRKLLRATGDIRVPTYQGKRGHPVYFARDFIPEVLREADGDYGLGYLLKRYPSRVTEVAVSSPEILLDVDTPEDFAKIQNKSLEATDPVEEFHRRVAQLRSQRQSFALATVIEVIGSASARAGSRAIFTTEGKNLLGWVGGGCAERFLGDECAAAIKEAKTRIVLANLDDEIFGLGVACGGSMRVFIEPVFPAEIVPFPIAEGFRNELRILSSHYGWTLKDTPGTPPASVEDLVLALAGAVAKVRGKSLRPMYLEKETPARFTGTHRISERRATVVGKSRITEALERHFTLLNFHVRTHGPGDYGEASFTPGEVVIIASHTSQDPVIVEKALSAGAAHVAMVGSRKRAEEVLTYLKLMHQEVSLPLYVPGGLDVDARNPDEIALSLVAEVITHLVRP